MDKQKAEEFVKYALKKVYFYIESGFWSKLDISTLRQWLSNFNTWQEEYCAAKLLDRFVYYSEDDIICLLKYGLYELIFKRKVLKIEIENCFTSDNNDIESVKASFLANTYVLPLLKENLSESSLAMLRYLTNDIGFPETNILNINNLSSTTLKNGENLIILDDFIGTGNQLYQFWNSHKVMLDGREILVNSLKNRFINLEIEYLCLVCTEEGYTNFHSDNLDVPLRITYCEMLSNKFKVFGKDSVYFNNDEVEECRLILEEICKRSDFEILGYNSLDYAIAFHHSIPDTSLPLFFKQMPNWKPLFKNKKTLDVV